jgi:hypothetical protein
VTANPPVAAASLFGRFTRPLEGLQGSTLPALY